MNYKNFKITVLIAVLGLIMPHLLYAQNNKVTPPNEVVYSTSNLIGDEGSFTSTNPHQNQMRNEKQNLLKQLDDARISNDMYRKAQLENQLNQIDGTSSVQLIENPEVTGGAITNVQPPFNNEGDYLNSVIVNNQGVWSSATQTESANMPHPGRIWVAAAVFNNGAQDTCKIYFSDNGGQTWTYAYYFSFGLNTDFRAGELDLELAFDGSVLWLYGVAGYSELTSGRNNSILFRFNTSAHTYGGYTLQWPGWGSNIAKYYDPRITSDNSFYTGGTYIYVACSFDTVTASGHYGRQKFAHIVNPFNAALTINYTMPYPAGFCWQTGTLGVNDYYWTDIAYFRTQGNMNRVITTYNNYGGTNIYMAWTEDYGTTLGGNPVLIENNARYGVRMVFNGGTNNYNGMVTYIRKYSGNDWDPFCRNTTDGGQNWTTDYIDNSQNRARSVDVIAPRGANNTFKIAYTQDSAAYSLGYYIGGSPYGWNQPLKKQVTPSNVDTLFAKVTAGYTGAANDNCLALYSLSVGSHLYASRLCMSTTGITNNNAGIPEKFELSQNYPNPFNPVTNIKFSIPQNSFVKLTVFDITGKTVEVLVNSQLAAGNYTFDFDASNLATGVYMYRLEAGDFSSVKKMMLIK